MLKRLLIVAVLLLACSVAASAQGVRAGDNFPILSSLTTPGQISTVSNAVIVICTFPANAVPCTNKATTYTSVTLGTPCSTSTQIVLAGTSTCVATTDGRGNWGFWAAPGNYDFTVTVSTGQSFGPFTISAGNAVSTTATNLSGPGSITGTFTGSPTLSGSPSFTGKICTAPSSTACFGQVQTARVLGCATGAVQFNTCDTTITWGVAFADVNYTVTCTGDAVSSGVPIVQGHSISVAKTASAVTVRTIALTAAVAQFTAIACTAIHD